ncbi:MAG: hypothetical protein GX786_00605, partial [Clostridiales bacterium]|nr:hypothetical protein [Clostridiales bacterium]
MTIEKALADCREKRPNQFSNEDLLSWLNEVELELVQEVFSLFEGFAQEKGFQGYGEETQGSTVLLVPPPYDSLYRYWLYAMVDFHLND